MKIVSIELALESPGGQSSDLSVALAQTQANLAKGPTYRVTLNSAETEVPRRYGYEVGVDERTAAKLARLLTA